MDSQLVSDEARQVQESLVSTLEHMHVLTWDMPICPEEYKM